MILHVCSGDVWAGAENQVIALLTTLLQAGDPVELVVFNPGRLQVEAQSRGIPVSLVSEENCTFSMVRQLRKLIRQSSPALMHTHGYKENLITFMAQFGFGVPMVTTLHGGAEFSFKGKQRLVQQLNSMLIRYKFRALVAVSGELATQCQRLWPGKVAQINNFAIASRIRRGSLEKMPPKAEKELARARKEGFVIGIVGRMVSLKRHDLAIDTLAFLRKQLNLPASLLIVGEGPEQNNLEGKAEAASVSGSVFFTGACDNPYPLLAGLDCLLICSDHEGVPMVMLEAMALGRPIVAHNVGGMHEAIDGTDAGILVDQQKPELYALAIAGLISDRASVGGDTTPEAYTCALVLKQYQDLYRKCLT